MMDISKNGTPLKSKMKVKIQCLVAMCFLFILIPSKLIPFHGEVFREYLKNILY